MTAMASEAIRKRPQWHGFDVMRMTKCTWYIVAMTNRDLHSKPFPRDKKHFPEKQLASEIR
jgi:hypothetical protein